MPPIVQGQLWHPNPAISATIAPPIASPKPTHFIVHYLLNKDYNTYLSGVGFVKYEIAYIFIGVI
jgi:hypothetical protein